MAQYEREKAKQVLADVGKDAAPDPDAVVARVGPDGRIELGRIDVRPPAPAESDDEIDATEL